MLPGHRYHSMNIYFKAISSYKSYEKQLSSLLYRQGKWGSENICHLVLKSINKTWECLKLFLSLWEKVFLTIVMNSNQKKILHGSFENKKDLSLCNNYVKSL